MAGKDIHFGTEARNKMLKGVNVLADAVAVTSVSYTHLTLPTTPYV